MKPVTANQADLRLRVAGLALLVLSLAVAYTVWDAAPSPHAGLYESDVRRIVDIRLIRSMLARYHQEHGNFPHVTASTAAGRWSELRDLLAPEFGGVFRQDPAGDMRSYDYKDGQQSQDYVVKAILESVQSSWLARDVDGLIYGIDCGTDGRHDRSYCMLSNSVEQRW